MEYKKNHLRTNIDVLGTLRTFEPLDSFFIRTEDSKMEYKTIVNKYYRLKTQGFIDGKFTFIKHEKGVLVFRTE